VASPLPPPSASPSPSASSGPVFPVSVKGVVFRDGRVLLLRNERQEWELPGGRLEIGETPEECVAREIAEETGWDVKVEELLDAWVYQPLPATRPDRRVLIVTYGCTTTATDAPTRSSEHHEIGLFGLAELGGLRLPDGYRRSITTWAARLVDR
jgi:8-oxo-dGTP pyrophosphatase MutT (NUDIX family)